MAETRLFALWTAPWAALAAACVYLLCRPLPAEWLARAAPVIRAASQYARIEPVATTWSNSVPSAAELDAAARALARRPLVCLPSAAFARVCASFTPAITRRAVQRVKSVLFSPCSDALKMSVLADPFSWRAPLPDVFTPAATGECAAVYVCTYGADAGTAVERAEDVAAAIMAAVDTQVVSAAQHASDLLVSERTQRARAAQFAASADFYQWQAGLEETLREEGMDIRTLGPFVAGIRRLGEQAGQPMPVAQQEGLLLDAGLTNLLRHFFFAESNGMCVCVHRLLPASGVAAGEARLRVREAVLLAGFGGWTTVASPPFLPERYYTAVRFCLFGALAMAALGIAVVFVVSGMKSITGAMLSARARVPRITQFRVAPGYRAYLRRFGLCEMHDFMCAEARLQREAPGETQMRVLRLHEAKHNGGQRRVDRIELPVRPGLPRLHARAGRCVLYLKREVLRPGSSVARERDNAVRMRSHGVPAVQVVACGEGYLEGVHQSFFLTADMVGYESLHHWQVFVAPLQPPDDVMRIKRALVRELGTIVRRYHQAGFHGFEWLAKHIFFRMLPDGRMRIRLIDLERVRGGTRFARLLDRLVLGRLRRTRLDDAAQINTQLFLSLFTLRERLRLYGLCVQREKLTTHDRAVLTRIAALSRRRGYIQYRTRVGDIYVNLAAHALFQASPAWSFDAFMALRDGTLVTRKRGRTVLGIQVGDVPWYLKRHTHTSLLAAVRRLLRAGRRMSNARLEWDAVAMLESIGIPTVLSVAMGERFRARFWERSSFYVSAGLRGGESLETLAARNTPLSFDARRLLAERVGRLARRLHASGLVHRDFYLGHIYVVGELGGAYRLHLLDLQRIRLGARLFNRWSRKDIAALYFSSLALPTVTRTDRLRFLLAYAGAERLDGRVKRFARRVAAKAARVARHTEKLLERRRRSGELPPLPVPGVADAAPARGQTGLSA
ncbi:hypothetical protein GX586_16425 [bacterium]|nr:hypothetical protein [bacterium]